MNGRSGYAASGRTIRTATALFIALISGFATDLPISASTLAPVQGSSIMKLIAAAIVSVFALAPAFAQDVTVSARSGKTPTPAEAAHCVAYYRAEAKLRRPAGAPFEETMRGEAWKTYLKSAMKGADSTAAIAGAEKDLASAVAKSPKGDWRQPYEESCGSYERVSLP
jgi:hypothetical protein